MTGPLVLHAVAGAETAPLAAAALDAPQRVIVVTGPAAEQAADAIGLALADAGGAVAYVWRPGLDDARAEIGEGRHLVAYRCSDGVIAVLAEKHGGGPGAKIVCTKSLDRESADSHMRTPQPQEDFPA